MPGDLIGLPTQYIFEEYKVSPATRFDLGRIFIFQYRFFEHDMTPLATPFAWEPTYHTFMAINWHYLHPHIRLGLFEAIETFHRLNRKTGKLGIDYRFLQDLFHDCGVCLRRYKRDGILHARAVPNEDFLDRHWKSPGAMEANYRQEMHNKSVMTFKAYYRSV